MDRNFPIFFPKKSQITELLVREPLGKNLHRSPQLTIYPSAHYLDNSGLSNCQRCSNRCKTCICFDAKLLQAQMGKFIRGRLLPSFVFSQGGLDYYGPYITDELTISNWLHCFHTSESCRDPDALTLIHRNVFETIKCFKKQEKLDLTADCESKKKFLSMFRCEKLILTAQEKNQIEEPLFRLHDVFARHNYDVGRNDQLRIELTPETTSSVYSEPTHCHSLVSQSLMI